MNPIAEGLDQVRTRPLSDVRRNLRIRWYRCPIESGTLQALNEPSDLRGLIQATGHLGLWVATGLSAYHLFALEVRSWRIHGARPEPSPTWTETPWSESRKPRFSHP